MQFDGFADHLITESLYLRDPENNGIEIYRDRPSEEWPRDTEGRLVMDNLPLNLQSLLSETNNGESNNNIPFPKGGIIGHMHLKVTNLERSIRFYHEKLGLDITADMTSMGAAFFSEGGYHHHVAVNTLYSLDGDIHREDVTGLKNFTIIASDVSFCNSIKSNIIINDPCERYRECYSIRSWSSVRQNKSKSCSKSQCERFERYERFSAGLYG